jgi:8-oxo-dGTP pyrophosphatase MutT (NUDIX family)
MHAYLMVLRPGHGGTEVLMGQKNIYLPPHGHYQYAAVARNAVQYVIPGGRVAANEQPEHTALREFHEATGVSLARATVEPLCGTADDTFFKVEDATGLDVGTINKAICEARCESIAYDHFSWFSVENAVCNLGNKVEYLALPWVGSQVTRALSAGFAATTLVSRANESHSRFLWALAQLVVSMFSPGKSDATAGESAP